MRLLFECTYVYDHPHVNSGIQRVVRNVVNHLSATQSGTDALAGVECLPVILDNNKVFAVKRLAPYLRESLFYGAQERFDAIRNRYWLIHHNFEQGLGLGRLPWLRRTVEIIFRLGTLAFILPFALVMLVLAPRRIHARMQPWYERVRNRYWLFHHNLEKRLGLGRFPRLRLAVELAFRFGTLTFALPYVLAMLVSAPLRIHEDLRLRYERIRNRYWLLHHNLEKRLGLGRFPRLRLAVELAFRFGTLTFAPPFALIMLLLAPQDFRAHMQSWYEHVRNRYWLIHHRLEQSFGLTRWRILRWPFYQAFRLCSLSFVIPWKLASLLANNDNRGSDDPRAVELDCRPGDVLVLLDSSWHADFFVHAERLKTQGVGIVAVIYDLIPLTHPQFCDAPLVKVFDTWFEWVARTADGFIAISETISDEVRADVTRRLGPGEAGKRWYHFFHLGSELDQASGASKVRNTVRALFSDQHSVYLMVSTIEPRKNHAYLLDAFERLWTTEPQSRAVLCIVGRVGWKCAPLVARIKSHPELGKRLFMFNDLSDTELEHCYRHSRSLVFPSFVEGFGLPLVEAMQRGLPAMASDIPVFREIGADFLAYFKLDDPGSLAALVSRFEADGEFPAARKLADWSWPGWRGSTRQLVERIAANVANSRGY